MMNDNEKIPERRSSGSIPSGMMNREYRRKDSAISTTSSLEALDFLADMCVEIDEIGTAMTSPKNRHFFSTNSDDQLLQSILPDQDLPPDHPSHTLKRECSEISPRSRSSLTPASAVSRTLSKGFSFSSTGSTTFGLDHSDALAILNGRSDSVEDRVIIPLTLFHYGDNGIYLVPSNPNDLQILLKGSQQTNHNSVFTVSLSHATAQQHHTQLHSLAKIVGGIPIVSGGNANLTTGPVAGPSPERSKSPTLSVTSSAAPSEHQPPARLINPKHIYKTSCDTYRVQMSKGSKTNPNGKFSRNTRNEVDALWLCEFALLLVERPCGFDDILMNGNYKCLLQRRLVTNSDDFALKLIQQMSELSHRGLLKPAETEKLTGMLPKFLPQYLNPPLSASATVSDINGGGGVIDVIHPSSEQPVQESPLPYSLYSPDAMMPSTLPNALPVPSAQPFFPETFNVEAYPEPSSADPHGSGGGGSNSNTTVSFNDADQKKRRRGGPTPVMVQRNHLSLSDDAMSLRRSSSSSSASPVFLQAPPSSATPAGPRRSSYGSLPLTTQNLAQVNVNTNKARQHYPELSYLTSQYVKQRSRSFEETISTAPIHDSDNGRDSNGGHNNLHPHSHLSINEHSSPPLRKYV
jgi:hypothetical protein